MQTCSHRYIERLFDINLLAIQLHVRSANDEHGLARFVGNGRILTTCCVGFTFSIVLCVG